MPLTETTPFSIIDPHTPHASTRKKLCVTDAGMALEESPGLLAREADKPEGSAPEGEDAAGAQHLAAFPTGGEGSWQSPHAPLPALY